VIAATPFNKPIPQTRTSHKRPKAVAATDRVMTSQSAMRRRAYRGHVLAYRLFFQPQQHRLAIAST